jgi:hypothetical protein
MSELSRAVSAFARDLSGFARTFDGIVSLRRELDHKPHAEGARRVLALVEP